MSVKQMTVAMLHAKRLNLEPMVLLDVREPYEVAYACLDNSVSVPLQQLPQRLSEFDPEQLTVVMCHHGVRSQQAAEYMVAAGFSQVWNLTGGIDAWSVDVDNAVPRY